MLRPSVHMLPGIGWCGAGLPPLPTACWWLTHPAAITGVSVSTRWDSPGGCVGPYRLFHFFAIVRCRVHDANSLQVRLQATVSCSQPECIGLLMSCQMVDWVSRGVVVSSGLFLYYTTLANTKWECWKLFAVVNLPYITYSCHELEKQPQERCLW